MSFRSVSRLPRSYHPYEILSQSQPRRVLPYDCSQGPVERDFGPTTAADVAQSVGLRSEDVVALLADRRELLFAGAGSPGQLCERPLTHRRCAPSPPPTPTTSSSRDCFNHRSPAARWRRRPGAAPCLRVVSAAVRWGRSTRDRALRRSSRTEGPASLGSIASAARLRVGVRCEGASIMSRALDSDAERSHPWLHSYFRSRPRRIPSRP